MSNDYAIDTDDKDLRRQLDKLTRINAALMGRVERSLAQQGNAYSLFHAAIGLEHQVRIRTDELKSAMIDLEKTNGDLSLARDLSERANRFKTRFFTAVGHDLLQPLHAARLTLSALEESRDQFEQRRLIGQIDHALLSVEELMKSILDLSKLEAGVMQPSIQTVDLVALFAALTLDLAPIASNKGLTLVSRTSRLAVRSDPLMLRRILQNLLANAVRYSETGGIRLLARRRAGRVRIEVWDTGPGIPASERDRIFEEFQRGSTSERGGGGFGLGLSIVQRMAQALDHEVGLCSRVGQGTRFHILAPAAVPGPDQPTTGREAHAGIQKHYGFGFITAVVLDNDAPVRDAMGTLLDKWSCIPLIAASLADIDRIIASAKVRPDIILADYHLDNDENGIEAIRRLRRSFGDDLPAIVVTADHSAATAAAAELSACEILRKPVRPAELRALMTHLLSR
ncbi:MAG: hybrid sensor histidine kinase/response regulator [Hyphomicrobiaceae bacterium]|nr:hybrid sensor histidine kinase/response regulator [Hyphomicrobiaceae bacterium]